MDLNFNCPKSVDFKCVEDQLNDSTYFENHQDSPLSKSRYSNFSNSKYLEKSNVFTQSMTSVKDNSKSVKFGNSSDIKVQQGIKFVSSKPVTIPKSPFLRTKYRTRSAKTEDDLPKQFIAQPMPSFKYKKPETSHHHIIPESPLLHTKKRAVERSDFDAELQNKREKERQEQERLIKLQKSEEQLKLKMERELRTFKANKMPSYFDLKIQKSSLPLTEPKSPNFSYKQRIDSSTDLSLEDIYANDRQEIQNKLSSMKSSLKDLRLKKKQ